MFMSERCPIFMSLPLTLAYDYYFRFSPLFRCFFSHYWLCSAPPGLGLGSTLISPTHSIRMHHHLYFDPSDVNIMLFVTCTNQFISQILTSSEMFLLLLILFLFTGAGGRQYFDLTHTFDKDAPTWNMPDAKDKNYFKKTQLLNKPFPTYTCV